MIQKIYIKDKIGEQFREWHSEGVIIASGTDTGKTTFTFNRISEQIVVPDILEIPEDYKEISG